jgi:hypothetical protein
MSKSKQENKLSENKIQHINPVNYYQCYIKNDSESIKKIKSAMLYQKIKKYVFTSNCSTIVEQNT